MAQKAADPCRNCGAVLPPGAAFCTLCGAAVNNRAAAPAPATVTVGVPGTGSLPGIVPVGITATGPLLAPREPGVDPRIAAATALVPGGAGRRLAAKLIDGVLPSVLLAVAAGIGASKISVTKVGEFAQVNLSWLLILSGIAAVLSLGYGIWLWLWEAKSGKTPGNLLVGLRTTNMAGGPAGVLAIFLRNVVVAVSSTVPTLGPLLVVISNTWDANGKRQGWHDKLAHTLVFNVKAGRDPLETGGIAERANFVPASVPTLTPVSSPLVQRPVADGVRNTAVPGPVVPGPVIPGPAVPGPGGPGQYPQGPITSVPGAAASAAPQSQRQVQFQQPAPQPQQSQFSPASSFAPQPPPARETTTKPFAEQPHIRLLEDEAGDTRVRPLPAAVGLRLTFDDGHTEDITAVALIGRNPAGYDGEMISRLVSVLDSSRSVSKTHLHVQASGEGLWVTDRNSTNGSAITAVGGDRTELQGGTPALAGIGARVHFGDRSFTVGRP
ncbi:RDD family protein [Arthrobacter sp. HLT1-20]